MQEMAPFMQMKLKMPVIVTVSRLGPASGLKVAFDDAPLAAL